MLQTKLFYLKDLYEHQIDKPYVAVLFRGDIEYTDYLEIDVLCSIKLLFHSLEREKMLNPDMDINDQAMAIIFSYILNPNIEISKCQSYAKKLLSEVEEIPMKANIFASYILNEHQLSEEHKQLQKDFNAQFEYEGYRQQNKQNFSYFPGLTSEVNAVYQNVVQMIKDKYEERSFLNISNELNLTLLGFENEKIVDPVVDIENKALSTICSYLLDPTYQICRRMDHIEGIHLALEGMLENKEQQEVLSELRDKQLESSDGSYAFADIYLTEGIHALYSFRESVIFKEEPTNIKKSLLKTLGLNQKNIS